MATHTFPLLPKIGYPEAFYAHRIREADQAKDLYAVEAYKVGQYITLGLNPQLPWEDKVRYFQHALRRHCRPPTMPDQDVRNFFRQLAKLVQRHAGHEALRMAKHEGEALANSLRMGKPQTQIHTDAMDFFSKLMGDGEQCPEWFSTEDYQQIKALCQQWAHR